MYVIKSLVVGASCLFALAQAQSIAFTKVPASVTAGKPTTLEWAGGDNSPVTITLKSGPAENLKTVAVITGEATGNSFSWTPEATLPSGEDYALQITQGVSDVNYSGKFSLSGGPDVVSSVSSVASSRTAISASSASSVGSKTSASAASETSVAASVSSLVSSLLSAISTPSSSKRLVVTTIVPGNVTTAAVGTGALGTGTGTPISRNNTLSRATLSSAKTVTTSVPATVTTGATGPNGATGGSNTGAAGSTSSPPPSGSSATSMASPLALVISAFVAIMYLG